MNRFRVTYSKTEALRYTGNLDIQKIWERFLRRARLPIAYSQGFHPQPRIQQACPLPLGFLSTGEQTDIYLDDDFISAEDLKIQLDGAPYPGIEITSITRVDLTEPSLSSRVLSALYQVEFFQPQNNETLSHQVELVLASQSIIRNRRGKDYDLRPLIEDLEISEISSTGDPGLSMQLSARQSATGRPEEVISALGLDPFAARYIRTRIIFAHLEPA